MNLTEQARLSDPWQQMLAGEWYLTNSKPLTRLRRQVKQQCMAYNNAPSGQRNARIRQLLPHADVKKAGGMFFCDYGVNVVTGSNFTFGEYLVILDAAVVTLGSHVSFGNGVVIATVNHHKDPKKRLEGWQQARPVEIGNYVQVGDGVSILPGACVPDNIVIPDFSVVTASSTFA